MDRIVPTGAAGIVEAKFLCLWMHLAFASFFP
jgi:hypothetical protein